jgi:hypothetical protein
VVDLTEDSSTLELLFQFIYPQRHPTLFDAPYEVVAPLAEAAEKYEVFAAMNICQIRILYASVTLRMIFVVVQAVSLTSFILIETSCRNMQKG